MLQADVEVDAISPQIDVVDLTQVTLPELRQFVTPLPCQPLNRRRAQAGLAAEEFGQRGLEVLGRDAAQIQHRQHFGDFGRATRPWWQDGAGEASALTPIVDAWCLNLQFAGTGSHRPWFSYAVADHHSVPCFVAMVAVLGDVLVDLGSQRHQQHAPGAFSHQRVQVELERILFRWFRSDYSQHAAYLSMDGLTAARLQQPGGYAALFTPAAIHNFRLYLTSLA